MYVYIFLLYVICNFNEDMKDFLVKYFTKLKIAREQHSIIILTR